MPQVAYVYRQPDGTDCTNGGISSQAEYLTVYGPNEKFEPRPFRFLNKPAPPVRMVPSNLRVMGTPMAVNLKPIDPETGEIASGWWMSGGNYASSCDSRFGEMIAEVNPALQYSGAVSIHDRQE